MDLFIKLGMLVLFFGVTIGIGLYGRKPSPAVNGFVRADAASARG